MSTARAHIEALQGLIVIEKQSLHKISVELVQRKNELVAKLLTTGERVALANQIAFLCRQVNELQRALNRHEKALHDLHQ